MCNFQQNSRPCPVWLYNANLYENVLSSQFDDIACVQYTDAKVQTGLFFFFFFFKKNTHLYSFKDYRYFRITYWMTLVYSFKLLTNFLVSEYREKAPFRNAHVS